MPETNNVICQLHLYKRIKRVKIVRGGGARRRKEERKKGQGSPGQKQGHLLETQGKGKYRQKESACTEEPKWGSLIS